MTKDREAAGGGGSKKILKKKTFYKAVGLKYANKRKAANISKIGITKNHNPFA